MLCAKTAVRDNTYSKFSSLLVRPALVGNVVVVADVLVCFCVQGCFFVHMNGPWDIVQLIGFH